jgi:hypothetical protein
MQFRVASQVRFNLCNLPARTWRSLPDRSANAFPSFKHLGLPFETSVQLSPNSLQLQTMIAVMLLSDLGWLGEACNTCVPVHVYVV